MTLTLRIIEDGGRETVAERQDWPEAIHEGELLTLNDRDYICTSVKWDLDVDLDRGNAVQEITCQDLQAFMGRPSGRSVEVSENGSPVFDEHIQFAEQLQSRAMEGSEGRRAMSHMLADRDEHVRRQRPTKRAFAGS